MNRITELFAFVAIDPFGHEAILLLPNTGRPMMAPAREKLELFRGEAEGRLANIGARLVVARFVRADDQGQRTGDQ